MILCLSRLVNGTCQYYTQWVLLPVALQAEPVVPPIATELIPVALELYKGVQQVFRKKLPQDLYRILDYEATLEFIGPRGKSALFSKKERVQFLQDDVQTIEDFAWGGGNVISNYSCTPGRVVDRYQDGDRWKFLISLRQAKKKGEIETFYIRRRLVNIFTKRDGWWQAEMRHQTERLKLFLIFPARRQPRNTILTERTSNKIFPLNESFWSDLPDGRKMLTWGPKQPRRFEIYTVKWQW